MASKFEAVAGPYQGPCGGLAWDGKAMLFSVIDEGRIMRFDPGAGAVEEFRRNTNRVNGIAFGPNGSLYACQEVGRRVIELLPDGSARPLVAKLDGKWNNHPCDLAVDRAGRIWFSDPFNPTPAPGQQIFPPLPHASVLRLERDRRGGWTMVRITYDTIAPRAVLLSSDERTLYVSDGIGGGTHRCTLRAYRINDDGSVSAATILHTFGADYRGVHRGIEGMCLDHAGNIVACAGWSRSGPGPLIYVFSPDGAILSTHSLPGDRPARCALGDAGLRSLYVTTSDGFLYRAKL